MSSATDAVATKNEIGRILRVTVVDENGNPEDISGAISKDIILLKPDGTVLTKTAAFFTDGKDGIYQYKTISGDLNQPGSWEWQGDLNLSATRRFRSVRQTFYVQDTI